MFVKRVFNFIKNGGDCIFNIYWLNIDLYEWRGKSVYRVGEVFVIIWVGNNEREKGLGEENRDCVVCGIDMVGEENRDWFVCGKDKDEIVVCVCGKERGDD